MNLISHTQMSNDNTTIYRKDYTPPNWLVDQVNLEFALDLSNCMVTAIIDIQPNPQSNPEGKKPLLLNGEEIELISLQVNSQILTNSDYLLNNNILIIDLAKFLPQQSWQLKIISRNSPKNNSKLSGLYASGNNLITQCEAEGFRRICFFPDRPDVMAKYQVKLIANKSEFPVLLSNGNLLEAGDIADGKHYTLWQDPFAKPCYLFALVAGKFEVNEKYIKTKSGKEVLLQIWVDHGNLAQSHHAMDSLVKAIYWDERRFDLELDLDRYMIVATNDFNSGAMENKGLNIFNSKLLLASKDTATDIDFDNVEAVIAHEYFHNWTGNRVTCRDWFQLTLKEGLTVFRDQQFSADMISEAILNSEAIKQNDNKTQQAAILSARAEKLIDNVKVLRNSQFPEDSGPMAHPIRPDSYQKIRNFYTATVYEKGAEVIRMLLTILGEQGFKLGMDLYFQRHDGQAVTCDDFVNAMADANKIDLTQFVAWYSQIGTPQISYQSQYSSENEIFSLTVRQDAPLLSDGTPSYSANLMIPIELGLIDRQNGDLSLNCRDQDFDGAKNLLLLKDKEQTWTFANIKSEPIVSILRGFSAPVNITNDISLEQLFWLLKHDSDPFNRWNAGQKFFEKCIVNSVSEYQQNKIISFDSQFTNAFANILATNGLSSGYLAKLLSLPTENHLLNLQIPADPISLRAVLIAYHRFIATNFAPQLLEIYLKNQSNNNYRFHPLDVGQRSLRSVCLRYLMADKSSTYSYLAEQQIKSANNFSEIYSGLQAIVQSNSPNREIIVEKFYQKYQDNTLILDKWFAVQATAWSWGENQSILQQVQQLSRHEKFNLKNPNKVYSLFVSFFKNNPGEFHNRQAYQYWAEVVSEIDPFNPQVASRLARCIELWQSFIPAIKDAAQEVLEKINANQHLSPDVREIVEKALNK